MSVQRDAFPGQGKLPQHLVKAIRKIREQPVSGIEKGLPEVTLTLAEIGDQGWNVLRGDIPLPALVIKGQELDHNIALMQAYCDLHHAWLAPHGKTTMAPQVWSKQLQAGSWAITVANIGQLQVCRAFGLSRVFVANEMVADYDIRYLAKQLHEAPDVEIYVLADSLEGIQRLVDGLKNLNPTRPLPVLVELGLPEGRCGVRNLSELEELVDAVLMAEPILYLAGVEGYEGIIHGAGEIQEIAAVDEYLQRMAEAVRKVCARLPDRKPFLVSAGGSMYFDRVVEILGHEALPGVQLVLRAGGYVTHDSGFYERGSPMGSLTSRPVGEKRLHPALELWSVVLSRPEPDLALLGMGGRDMPTDIELPVPLRWARHNGEIRSVDARFKIFKSNDQHAYLRVPPDCDLMVGDRLGCGISHPCTAFDKWRTIYVVDPDLNIVDAVRTFF